MKLRQIGPNQTEVTTGDCIILFSYQTPVAAVIKGEAFKTAYKWSKTISKHINKWLDGRQAKVEEQKFFDFLTIMDWK